MRFLLLLCAVLLFSACEKETAQEKSSATTEISTPKSPKSAQTKFILEDMNGTAIELELKDETLKASVDKPLTLLFFYTDWCPSCQAQTPELERLYQRFGEDLFIIGLPLEPSKKRTTFFSSASIDQNNELAKRIYTKVRAGANMPIPLLLLLKDGKYFSHYVGAVPYEILESDIKRAKGE